VIFYYGTQLSPHMDKTPEGYLICRDVPIARTGTQEYLARELQLDGDPERVVTVNRYPEDVFAPAALASFEGKDVTAGHPPEQVGRILKSLERKNAGPTAVARGLTMMQVYYE